MGAPRRRPGGCQEAQMGPKMLQEATTHEAYSQEFIFFLLLSVNTVAKITRSGRRQIIALATSNQKLLNFSVRNVHVLLVLLYKRFQAISRFDIVINIYDGRAKPRVTMLTTSKYFTKSKDD